MKNNSVDKCFNLYYLNLNKVYELSMMINNAIMTNIQQERNTSLKYRTEIYPLVEHFKQIQLIWLV